jgi:hypothetical protein
MTAAILAARTDADNVLVGLAALSVWRIVRKIVLNIPIRNATILTSDKLMQWLIVNEEFE